MATITFLRLVLSATLVVQTRCTNDLANTVSTVGANVTMRCKTRSGNCSGVTWGIGPTAVTIYKGEVGFLGNYSRRYSIDATSGCHLKIKNVQLTDAGRLTCVDESSSTTIARSAELIVLESEPKCTVTASAETTAEGDRVDLRCEVIFNGTNHVSMTWKDMENVPPSTKTGRTVRLSHAVTAERPIVPSYECVVSFEIAREGTTLVPNIPTASCQTPPIRILYGVKSAELTPSQSIHYPGSVVNCSSDGNPLPSFKWQESGMENGPWKDIADVIGPEFTTCKETSYYYRCVASNVVKNINYNATSSIFRIIYSEQSNDQTAETTGMIFTFGFGIGFVVAIVLFVVVFLILFRLQFLQFRKTPGNTPKALTGSSEESNDKSKKEHNTTTLVQEYDYLELNKERQSAVPIQSTLPAEATYASLQKQEDESHCYESHCRGREETETEINSSHLNPAVNRDVV